MSIRKVKKIENKAVRELVEEIQSKIDCQVLGVNKKNHYVLLLSGEKKVTIPGTPSDFRSMRNTRTKIRRLGYDI